MAQAPSSLAGPAGAQQQQEQPFRLLDLPPELWSNICKFAVVEEDKIKFDISRSLQYNERFVRQSAITRTCRLLRAEALPLFYMLNRFTVLDCLDEFASDKLQRWLCSIGSRNRRHLGKLEILASSDIDDTQEHFEVGGRFDGHIPLRIELSEVNVRRNKWGEKVTDKFYKVHFAESDEHPGERGEIVDAKQTAEASGETN